MATTPAVAVTECVRSATLGYTNGGPLRAAYRVSASRGRSMGSVEEDRQAILEDIRAEEALQQEIKDLEAQADRLRAELLRRRAILGDGAAESSSATEGAEGRP